MWPESPCKHNMTSPTVRKYGFQLVAVNNQTIERLMHPCVCESAISDMLAPSGCNYHACLGGECKHVVTSHSSEKITQIVCGAQVYSTPSSLSFCTCVRRQLSAAHSLDSVVSLLALIAAKLTMKRNLYPMLQIPFHFHGLQSNAHLSE